MIERFIEKLIYNLKRLSKKPFKVGIISYYYLDELKQNNGVAIHAYYLSRELAKLGCEVHIFTSGGKNSTKTIYLGLGKLIIHKIDTKLNFNFKDNFAKKRLSQFIFDNKVISEITKENSHEKFDIIHTHGWLTAGAFISKYFNNIKWIHTFHAIEKKRLKFMSQEEKKHFKIARWIESTINYADALITVSLKLKTEVLQNYPIHENKIFYIPNGVDSSLFKPAENQRKEKKIIYIGRFSLEKGIDFIPKIVRKVFSTNDQAKFIIVASIPMSMPPSLQKIKKELETLVKQYKERFVWYNELLSREQLAKLYNEGMIYIQPSRYEAFGLCVLEAMACGDAVICSDKGGLPELVGNAGTIISLNSTSFAKQINHLLENHRLRERYIKRAIEKSKLFSWENVGKQTIDLYYNLINKTKQQDL